MSNGFPIETATELERAFEATFYILTGLARPHGTLDGARSLLARELMRFNAADGGSPGKRQPEHFANFITALRAGAPALELDKADLDELNLKLDELQRVSDDYFAKRTAVTVKVELLSHALQRASLLEYFQPHYAAPLQKLVALRDDYLSDPSTERLEAFLEAVAKRFTTKAITFHVTRDNRVWLTRAQELYAELQEELVEDALQ